jgi:hypothetical protein
MERQAMIRCVDFIEASTHLSLKDYLGNGHLSLLKKSGMTVVASTNSSFLGA